MSLRSRNEYLTTAALIVCLIVSGLALVRSNAMISYEGRACSTGEIHDCHKCNSQAALLQSGSLKLSSHSLPPLSAEESAQEILRLQDS